MLLTHIDLITFFLATLATIYSVTNDADIAYRIADRDSLLIENTPYSVSNFSPSIPSLLAVKSTGLGTFFNRKRHLRYLTFLLILRSSDTELNPGPGTTSHPDNCGVCNLVCDWGQKAICCDTCETWYHTGCIHMNDNVFLPYQNHDSLEFVCFSCGVPNFSASLFDSVYADPCADVPNSPCGSTHSIHSSDISNPESVSSCNISNLSSISKDTSSASSEANFRPSCSSPIKRQKQKLRTNNIRIASLNIQSATSSKKKASLWNFIDSVNCDVICGCETWLNPTIYDAEVLPPNSNYSIHRKDRADGYGGSLILVRDNITSERVEVNTSCDALFLKIDCINKESIIIGSLYRPTNNDENYATELFKVFSEICRKFRNSTIWITGDFNLPDIDWATISICGHQYRKSINEQFLLLQPELDLSQIVDFPTRAHNTLDLFLTNRPDLVNRCTAIPGISDHHALFIDTNMCATRRKPAKRTLYMWGKANVVAIKEKSRALSDTILDSLNTTSDINKVWNLFKDGCHHIIKDEVPSRESSQRFNQPWITRDVRQATRLKRRWFRRAKKTDSPQHWAKYQTIKRKTQRLCRSAHDGHVSSMLQDNENPKIFWNYIKGRKKDNFGVSALKKDGLTYNSGQQKADILNDQFSSVFTHEDTHHLPTLPPSRTPTIPNLHIDTRGVHELLHNLKPHKAAGPDKLPSRLLKLAAEELAACLTALFQLSINTGKVPADWKTALVSPVFKKGTRTTPSNYRPISLTAVTCKILEHIIFSNVMSHFGKHRILSDSQHGFRKRRSCETQLLITVNKLAKAIDNNQQIDAILLDFSKAFDKVPHQRLLYKLDHYGVRGNILSWIEDFLSSRTQQVVLEGATSATSPVTSGVPQGSVLGPLLFLAYINDMPAKVHPNSITALFADDSLLYRTIRSQDSARQLQEDLDSLAAWKHDWQMAFNPDKCEVLHISTKRKPLITTYSIHGTPPNTADSAKYFGVTITKDLSWKTQISNNTKKANSTMSFIRRTIRSSPPNSKATAYKTYVRPVVEYASSVWSPHHDSEIHQLEMVQRRAARFVKNDYQRTSSVSDIIHDLHWDTLQHRRDTTRLTIFYKIINHDIDITPDPPLHPARSIRGSHDQRIRQLQPRSLTYQHSFFPATIVMWNRLSQYAVDQRTVEGFQVSLARHFPH